MFQPISQQNTSSFNQQPKKHGSTLKLYKDERIREEGHYGFCSLKNILAIPEYKSTSTEEIRYEDYELSRKPNTSSTSISSGTLPVIQTQQQQYTNNWNNNAARTSNPQGTTNSWLNMNKTNEFPKTLSNFPSNSNFPTNNSNNFTVTPQTTTNPWNTSSTINSQPATNTWSNATTANQTLASNTQPSIFTQPNIFTQPSTTTQPNMFTQPSVSTQQSMFTQPSVSTQPTTPGQIGTFIPTLQQSNQLTNQNTPNNFSHQQTFIQPNNMSNYGMPIRQENSVQQTQNCVNPADAYNYSQHSYQNTTNLDPYSVSQIQFQTSPVQEVSLKKLLAKDFFEDEKNDKELKLEINKENKHERKNRLLEIKQKKYCIPSLDELKNMGIVKNLRLCIGKQAYIDYLEDIKTSDVVLDNKLEVVSHYIYMKDNKGVGLNKRARVTINEFWPFFRGKLIKTNKTVYPEKGVVDRFIYELKNDEILQFISYDIETGCYVYEVNGFEQA